MKHAYGWLRGNKMWWKGGRGIGGTPYEYGWPSGGSAESDVWEQYLFDEGSGNLTGEANSLVLTAFGANITYNVSASGAFSNLSPGIAYGVTSVHYSNNITPAINVGVSDFTIEYWYKNTSVSDETYAFDMYNIGGTAAAAITVLHRNLSGRLDVTIKDTDAAGSIMQFSTPSSMNDGNMHKIRIVADRSGNCEVFYDGSSLGTSSIAVASASIDANYMRMGGEGGAGLNFIGSLHEWRISGNITNNSGGPGGG